MRNVLGRIWSVVALVGAIFWLTQTAPARVAFACGIGPCPPGSVGYEDPNYAAWYYSRMSMGPQMSPAMVSNPYAGGVYGYSGSMTGQMPTQQDYYNYYQSYVSNYLNWRGTQRLSGDTYIPPIGGAAIENHMMWNQMFGGAAQ